ncbi:hypothetical protein [Parasphingorhabdus pacifica]
MYVGMCRRGYVASHKRVEQLMRVHGIVSLSPPKKWVRTTKSVVSAALPKVGSPEDYRTRGEASVGIGEGAEPPREQQQVSDVTACDSDEGENKTPGQKLDLGIVLCRRGGLEPKPHAEPLRPPDPSRTDTVILLAVAVSLLQLANADESVRHRLGGFPVLAALAIEHVQPCVWIKDQPSCGKPGRKRSCLG